MPVMRNGPAHLDGRASSPSTDRGTIRVLIADDDPGIRGFLRAVLTDAGITAVEAADGREARRLIADHPPDVVLIDWVMEDGGLPLARELVDAHCMNGRVIMLTGLLDPRDRRAARRVGIEHFFVKPPDIDRLIAAIRAAASATTRAD